MLAAVARQVRSVVFAGAASAMTACMVGPTEAATCTALHSTPTLCGPTEDFAPVNRYAGQIASVHDREDAVALIDGTCTGTLIAAGRGPVVLTAGHCVELGETPLVAFNVESEPDGDPLVTGGTVIERALEPDYALIRLAQLPNVAPTRLTDHVTEEVAIIQHPHGRAKVVAQGRLLVSCDGHLAYQDLDTLTGSSGAGVLNRDGALLGLHTDGNCAADGTGTNRGSSATRVIDASRYLESSDLARR